MTTLRKLFILREDRNAQALYAFLKANWKSMAEQGKPLAIEIKPEKTKRSLDQNARYWAMLNEISEQVWLGGRQYSAEVWHEQAKRIHLGLVDMPGGTTMGMSTAGLSVGEFAEFMTKVEVWAIQELGAQFHAAEVR